MRGSSTSRWLQVDTWSFEEWSKELSMACPAVRLVPPGPRQQPAPALAERPRGLHRGICPPPHTTRAPFFAMVGPFISGEAGGSSAGLAGAGLAFSRGGAWAGARGTAGCEQRAGCAMPQATARQREPGGVRERNYQVSMRSCAEQVPKLVNSALRHLSLRCAVRG